MIFIDSMFMSGFGADGEVHITEKLFIKEVAKSLDFDLNDLNLLFES